MPGRELSKQELHELLLDTLGDAVEQHSEPDEIPFEVQLQAPLPRKVRFYMFNVAGSGREGECKINVRLPGHEQGETYTTPDRSDEYVVILGGYDEEYELFVFWDDTLYDEYREVRPLQVKESTLETGAEDGFTTQHRDGGEGGETVIVADAEHLPDALRMRDRLIRIRALLDEHLPERWRSSSSKAQVIERVVDVFLEDTDPTQPTQDRRLTAQHAVADEHGVELETIQEKTGRLLWDDREPGEQGYQREYFDPVLEEIEAAWRSMDDELDPASNYTTVTETVDDIHRRIQQSTLEDQWLGEQITETIVTAWTEALSNFDMQTVVSERRAVILRQIEAVYDAAEAKLEEQAEALQSGELNVLSPTQTLFMVYLRDLQEQYGLTTNVDQVKLRVILIDGLTVESDGDTAAEDTEHPILTHITDAGESISIYKFTGPPDYWLTSVEYGAVSFEPEYENRWEQLSAGDVALIHSQATPSHPELPEQPAGLIGAAIIGDGYEKSDPWWWDEHESNVEFPFVRQFERVFYTGEIEAIDLTTPITDKDQSIVETELDALTQNLLPIDEADDICRDVFDVGFPNQGSFVEFAHDDGSVEHERPTALLAAFEPSMREAPPINIHKPFTGDLREEILDELYFPDDEGAKILEQIEAALRAGEHIVLTGPPGTGKTAIANKVTDALVEDYPWQFSGAQVTTATADWSTFDTVGGYMPSEERDSDAQLTFSPGIILNRLKVQRIDTQRNEPVVIDELNRADIDKAFGQLFTVLSDQSVQLPYTRAGNEIEIRTADSLEDLPQPHQYVVPESWSIFATMNTYDKTSLYEMSYAFMRRFSFISIGVPELPKAGAEDEETRLRALIDAYAESWQEIDPTPEERLAVARVWRNTNHAVDERAIGPAIVKDILGNITQYESRDLESRLTNAVISYVFPQLEGVPQRGQIANNIADVPDVDGDRLRAAAKEILQVTFDNDE